MHVLVNWLVQGTAFAVVVAGGMRLHRGLSAATRERVWWFALVAVALMPIVALLREWAIAIQPSAAVALSLSKPLIAVQRSSNAAIAVAVSIWAIWAVAGLARLAVDLLRLRRAKQLAAPFPPDREPLLRVWTSLHDRGRQARLVVSRHVRHAAVLGLSRPLIAVAPSALAQLTDEELDQVVLHEYAHIQRRDDILVVAQRIIVALAGWHPAIWWLDRALTTDREIVCDDWVIAGSGARSDYARCLVKLASQGMPSPWSIAPGALRSRSQLAARVSALVDPRREPAITSSKTTLRVALPAVAVLAVLGLAMPFIGVAPAENAPLIDQIVAAAAPMIEVETDRTAAPEPPVQVPIAQQQSAREEQTVPEQASSEAVWPAQSDPEDAPPEMAEAASLVPAPLSATVFGQMDLHSRPASVLNDTTAASAQPPWKAAAVLGLFVGDRSRLAAVTTARFFSRAGTSFARAF